MRNHAGNTVLPEQTTQEEGQGRLRWVEVDQAFGRRSTPKQSVGFQLSRVGYCRFTAMCSEENLPDTVCIGELSAECRVLTTLDFATVCY